MVKELYTAGLQEWKDGNQLPSCKDVRPGARTLPSLGMSET